MADIARLGFEVDSSGLKKGEAALEDVTGAAAKAEKATGGLTNAFARIEKLLESVERATRDVEKAIKLMGGASGNAGKQVDGLGASAQNAQRTVDGIAASASAAGAVVSSSMGKASVALGVAAGASATAAMSIQKMGAAANAAGNTAMGAMQGAAKANDNAALTAKGTIAAYEKLLKIAEETYRATGTKASRPAQVGNSGDLQFARAYADEMDRLRAKFNPVYAAISQYKSAVAEIRGAHASGAISAKEMAAAIGRVRTDSLAAIATAKGLTAASAQQSAAMKLLASTMAFVGPQLAAFGAMASAMLVSALSVGPLFKFEDAVAEVGTIVDRSKFNFDGMKKSALEMSKAFGGGATTQIQAFNDVLSAGTDDLGKATEIVRTANQLAVGGATDVATATNGLTSILNAYGDKVGSVQQVSDAMFIAMRDGKTTIAQLSSGLGRVAPLAAQTGVSFDELVASIAALTLGGVSTDESITGVRAILSAVAKPSSEAVKLAKALGLEFTTASLKAKGFQGFLADLIKKTGGNTDALAILMGGVEALAPAMALSGAAGAAFNATMDHMKEKAGATQTALQAMEEMSPGYQASRVWAAMQAEIIGVADAANGGLVTALRSIADNMSNIVSVAKIAGAALLVAFGPAIIGAVVSLTVAVGTGLAGAFAAMWAAAGGPVTIILAGLAAIGVAAWEFRDKIKDAFGIDLEEIARNTINGAINVYQFAADAIPLLWAKVPSALGDVAVSAANGVIKAVEGMINSAIGMINNLLNEAKVAASAMGKVLNIDFISPVDFGSGVSNPNAGAINKLGQDLSNLYRDQMAQNNFADWNGTLSGGRLGGWNSGQSAEKVVSGSGNSPSLGGGGADNAAKSAEQAAKKYADLVRESNRFIASQTLEQQTLGMSEQAAAAFRYEQEMLNKAANDNIVLTASQKTQINGLATAMAAAEAATKAAKEAFDFAKDGLKGFLSDLRSGLKNGESFWTAFGNAASNVLDKVIGKIEDQLVNALLSATNVGGSGGLGSILGSLFGGLGSFGSIGLYAKGGVVHAATGGRISGSGTSTSDSIPAMLSAGEFVVNAAAAKAWGPFLSAINDNHMPRMAAGGYVSKSTRSAPQYDGRGGASLGEQTPAKSAPVAMHVSFDLKGANGDAAIEAAVMRGVQASAIMMRQQVPGLALNGLTDNARRRG